MSKVVAILPAYNAEKTLKRFLSTLPKDIFSHVVLVDDSSRDKTYEIAKKYKWLKVFKTPQNLGYGGNLKFCLSIAEELSADIMIEIHPDGEYKTDGILPAINEVKNGAKLVLGNRFSKTSHALESGMYIWKYPFLRLLSFIDNTILGTEISDLHQGFRVYTKELLESINFRSASNSYLFSFEIIAMTAFKKLKITEVAVSTKYEGKKRGANLKSVIIYSLGTFKVLVLFLLAKLGVAIQLFSHHEDREVCPNCKNSYLVEFRLRVSKYKIFFCKICQNGFLNPIPTKVGNFYPSSYWNYKGLLGRVRQILFDIFQKRRESWIQQYVPSGGEILDVGSGEGRFGNRLMQISNKYKVTNLEAIFAKTKNESVLKVDFLKWKSEKKFDAICFWESLEHVREPQKYLERANKLLKDGGHIFIEYPRFDTVESRLFGKNWFHLDVPRHMSYLTSKGIEIISKRAGLQSVESTGVYSAEYSPGFAISCLRSLKQKSFILLIPFSLIGFLVEYVLTTVGQSTISIYIGINENKKL